MKLLGMCHFWKQFFPVCHDSFSLLMIINSPSSWDFSLYLILLELKVQKAGREACSVGSSELSWAQRAHGVIGVIGIPSRAWILFCQKTHRKDSGWNWQGHKNFEFLSERDQNVQRELDKLLTRNALQIIQKQCLIFGGWAECGQPTSGIAASTFQNSCCHCYAWGMI